MKTATRTTHTPGPWSENEGFVMGATGDFICDPHCNGGPEDHAERDANAHLIAAAPDYYDAAEAIRAHVVAAERLDDGHECSIPADMIRALLEAHRRAYAP